MIILKGKVVSDVSRSYNKKDGTSQAVRELALNSGSELDNMIVEVPVDFKLPKADSNGDVEIPFVRANSRTWNNELKQFSYNRVRFFIEKK